MKRHFHLWPEITAFDNLLKAANKAQKGKRYRDSVLAFNYDREQELFKLREELIQKSYCPGAYRTFEIYEPKRRLISAAPYRDRVVHHALCNIIVPLIEPSFIFDSYANREWKGSHRALRRFTHYLRSSRYILKCDLKWYFPSIDHEILKQVIRTKIGCQDTLWLMDLIIDNSNEQPPAAFHFPGDDLLYPLERKRGLPIGNLTSQFFSNWYLNKLDHFVKEQLRAKKYVRYVDDFAIFDDDPSQLRAIREAIESFLVDFRLKLHPVKTQIFETRIGANFLGFFVLPDRIRVRSENLKRARRRFRDLQADYAAHKLSLSDLTQRLQSWEAHLKHGDTHHLRQQVFASLGFSRVNGNAEETRG